jgi:hypothetical protein
MRFALAATAALLALITVATPVSAAGAQAMAQEPAFGQAHALLSRRLGGDADGTAVIGGTTAVAAGRTAITTTPTASAGIADGCVPAPPAPSPLASAPLVRPK